MSGGDDLDDGLVLDASYLLDASNDSPTQNQSLSAPLDEESEFRLDTTPVAPKKRKRPEKSSIEPKQKKQKSLHDASRISMCQPPDALAQHLERSLAKAFPKTSQLERDDLVIPESSIVDTTTFTAERKDSSLSEFITLSAWDCTHVGSVPETHALASSAACPTLASRIAQRPKHHAAPTAIVLAGAALRVADLTRAVRPLKGEAGGEIAKVSRFCIQRNYPPAVAGGFTRTEVRLTAENRRSHDSLYFFLFAKHFKLKDHVAHLAKTRVGVAVGTPARISQLLAEPDALSVKALSHIVLDLTFIDTKQRSLLDIPETRVDTLRGVLGHSRIRERLLNGKTKIVIF
ncbi:U3-containing 90S pre-ribosomal complex subunit [Rhizoctonia solani]|uniref:U3-containing 90S pre-ribosomal complex subunit n=1 Tax=Rhizoctonia solani TaxID=456999 RepID=A0A8H7M7C8_9AGAM|nr:U3-containing 90S pre-ribosomal complex subunit [Rhizoctonia solani]